MNTQDEKTLWRHANPQAIQHSIIKDMEDTIAGGRKIMSPSNVTSFLIEAFTNTGANLALDTLDELNSIHPNRITFIDDLYKHMSDYDYVGMFNTPASTNFEMLIELEIIIEQSVIVDGESYKKLIIPYGTYVKVGRYNFSLHYPIEIRIHNTTNTVTVVYDATRPNQLSTISNNMLESRVFNDSGVSIVAIKIPMVQFNRTDILEDSFNNTPFSKLYTFDSGFYAVRIFTNYDGDYQSSDYHTDHNGVKWWELHQSLSSEIYDPDSDTAPTALIEVDTVDKTLRVTIPYVYITNERIGKQVKIELLTSEGFIDINAERLIGTSLPTKFPVVGDIDADRAVIPLTKDDNVYMSLMGDRIVGGNNGLSFDDLRHRVIHSDYDEGLIVTPPQVEAFFKDVGFGVSKFKDGITQRIYLCHKELSDNNGGIISSGVISTILNSKLVNNNTDEGVSSIKYFPESGTYTVLPSTIYKYDDVSDTTVPITDGELKELNQMSNSNKVAVLNNNTYTYSPFYTRLSINSGIPTAYSYNLQDPSINSTVFNDEAGLYQLSIYASAIEFDPVIDSYVLTLDILNKNSDIVKNDANGVDGDIKVVISINNKDGSTQYLISDEGVEIDNDIVQYKFKLKTTYFITNENLIAIEFDNATVPIAFTSYFNVMCFINNSVEGAGSEQGLDSLPSMFDGMYIASHNTMNITLASQITEIFNATDIAYEMNTPQLNDSTEYAKHTSTVFKRENGVIAIEYDNDDKPHPIIDFHIGDYVIKENTTQEILLTSNELDDNYVGNYDGYLVVHDNHSEDYIISSDTYSDVLQGDSNTINIALPNVTAVAGLPVRNSVGDITMASREIHYRVDMIQVNRRILFVSDISKYGNYASITDYERSVRESILSYSNNVDGIKGRLLPFTEIYYRPSRSIGTASFKISSSDTTKHSLEIASGFKLHVKRQVISDDTLKLSIRTSIIKIIDVHTTKETFSLVDVATEILKTLSHVVTSVDIIGIDDNPAQQTLIHVDDGVILNLKHILKLEKDGSISSGRDLSLVFLVSEDT